MSIPKKPFKLNRNLFRRIRKLYDAAIKALANSVMRSLRRIGKRPRWSNAGFALPTTIMVLLVVILLTTALVLRSFDRNRNAVLSRSEQVIQNTSTPALDRGRAKLAALLADPKLPRGTPPDTKLLEVMNDSKYDFGDETRLKLAFDLNRDGNLDTAPASSDPTSFDPKSEETLNTAWKYPVDTDGNGRFDAFTLYGLFWRSPDANASTPRKERLPLEARSLPQETNGAAQSCKSAGQSAATSVQQGDWLKQGANLSKAFYVYAATVPITNVNNISLGPFPDRNKFENNSKGDKAFSGLELQTDRYRSGLNNTAVWYEDDLVINPGGEFRVNGRVFTNSNLLMAGVPGSGRFRFFQVSSKYSCFYEEANSQINVGGNVGTGDISQSSNQEPATVDLYKGFGEDIQTASINDTTKSTSSPGGNLIAYNQAAYERRISLMKEAALALCSGCTPNEPPTKARVNATYTDTDLQESFADALDNNTSNDNPYDLLGDQIEIYLRNLTRRVPYAEISSPDGTGAEGTYTASNVFTGGNIEPPAVWREPLSGNSFNNTTAASVSLVPTNLPQTNPDTRTTPNSPQEHLGDRIVVGNNLPALWKKDNDKWVGQNGEKQDYTDGTQWTTGGGTRYRTTQVQALDNLGVTDRNGFWEKAAALSPRDASNSNTGGGGLRIVTGAGIYVDGKRSDVGGGTGLPSFPRDAIIANQSSFLPEPSWDTRFVDPTNTDASKILLTNLRFLGQDPIPVWPDLMPMTGGKAIGTTKIDITNDGVEDSRQKGDLLMRATAVYHYVDAANANQTVAQLPIACVSSYYDPTDSTTARNPVGLPDVSGGIDIDGDGDIERLFGDPTVTTLPAQPTTAQGAKSNNGVVYGYPGSRSGYDRELRRQARLAFPNGRIVNQPLRTALQNQLRGQPLTFADYSAIDTAICAIAILNGSVTPTADQIPHGTIKEGSFLDAREVKAIDTLTANDPNYGITSNYDLPLEQRQPLEIRVTDIDLGLLAETTHESFDTNGDGIAETEYLLPNSGIIYASRDDALPDTSNPNENGQLSTRNIKLSQGDFRLDETRHPKGIRLINGLRLARGQTNTNNVEEKGLILATNVPAYVRGHLNLHLQSNVQGPGIDLDNPTELEEFTQTLDTSNWSNFYDRGNANGTGLNRRFACRQGQTLCLPNGDQWRPATILADAITLQSRNFQDGYRSQGDFDLRNNAGNAAYTDPANNTLKPTVAGSRMGQGFFDNSFVTSSPWSTGGAVSAAYRTSYLVNGVTPIQRRANVFAYDTESCKKIPVSACTPADWLPDSFNTSNAPPAPPPNSPQPNQQRYARRVAFQRAPGTAKYTYDNDGYPIPTAISPNPVNNSLWFRTRIDNGNENYGGNLASNQKLALFQPKYPGNYPVTGLQDKLQIPDLRWLRHYLAASPGDSAPIPTNPATPVTALSGNPPTHGPAGLAADTVTTRLNNVFTQQFNAANYPANRVFQLLSPGDKVFLDFSKAETITAGLEPRTIDLTGGGKMRVFSAPSLFLNRGNQITLSGDAGSVFVFMVNSLRMTGTPVTLNGVLPDNVYWIVNGPVDLRFGQFKGNVLARGNITFYNKTELEGRALSSQGNVVLANTTITAPDGNYPRLVPVTQLQSPDGTPVDSGTELAPGNASNYPTRWLQQAATTNYNAAFVVGDSPPRPDELSSGFNNLVRLQENWAGQSITIKGSFIQQKRSAFATAPFPTMRKRTGTSSVAPFIDGTDGTLNLFDYTLKDIGRINGYWTANGSTVPGTPPGQLPYYGTPARRQWGFDVGLLSQQPDLFSQRFTQDISNTQNYYRQVGRDDRWIQTLLCAKERPSQTSTTYSQNVVSDQDRPNCEEVTNLNVSAY